jgi:hypothetical protein
MLPEEFREEVDLLFHKTLSEPIDQIIVELKEIPPDKPKPDRKPLTELDRKILSAAKQDLKITMGPTGLLKKWRQRTNEAKSYLASICPECLNDCVWSGRGGLLCCSCCCINTNDNSKKSY